MTNVKIDPAYQHRLDVALTDALFEASMDKETGVTMLRSAEIIIVLLSMLATTLALSEMTETPEKCEETIRMISHKLREYIATKRCDEALMEAYASVLHPKNIQ